MENKVNVRMLGTFSMESEYGIIDYNGVLTDKVFKLLSYMILNRNRYVSVDEYAGRLWEEQQIINPYNSLKNLVYRARKITKDILNGKSCIVADKGSYRWNRDILVWVDVEELEYCRNQALMYKDNEEIVMKNCRRALDIFGGEFMPKDDSQYWGVVNKTYYISLFLKCTKSLLVILNRNGEYFEIIEKCGKALKIDEMDEELHCYMLRALMESGQEISGREYYTRIRKKLFENFGEEGTKEIEKTYKTMVNRSKEISWNVNRLSEILNDADRGALECDYGAFKEIYKLLMRQSKRYNTYFSLILITCMLKEQGIREHCSMRHAMNILNNQLINELRQVDVISMFSATQTVVILQKCDTSGTERVMDKIIVECYKKLNPQKYKIHYNYVIEK